MARPAGVIVVGSIAQDYVESPVAPLEGELGGSAVYFALAARHLGPVAVVGCVGTDRANELRQVLAFADLSRLTVTDAPTYTWRARRPDPGADAETLERFPGGYAGYQPEVGPLDAMPECVFLGSADPAIQLAVASAVPSRALVAGDTMDVFIDDKRVLVEEMVGRCHLLFATERELELLMETRGAAAAATRALDEFLLTAVVIKRGSGGAILWTREIHQRVSAVPVDVVDPTGAGDGLAGGMLGRLAQVQGAASSGRDAVQAPDRPSAPLASDTLLEALEWGMVMASFAIQAPGLAGLRGATPDDVEARLSEYRGAAGGPG